MGLDTDGISPDDVEHDDLIPLLTDEELRAFAELVCDVRTEVIASGFAHRTDELDRIIEECS